ncbi:MAG: Type 1 glutamine amidotransferase-like domain-containing protein [Firmicutes bacterium]|nr:Type 1 glutamine amidotransferase-like domain-containing protein [Bacillota bacterium]
MKTIIFSNTEGCNIFSDGEISFIKPMEAVLATWNLNGLDLIYVDAPFEDGRYDFDMVFNNIIKCFKKANISFNSIQRITLDSGKPNLTNKNAVWFLTGGNPLAQMEIIRKYKLENILRKADLVIGLCAGGINLSKYALLTSDADFNEPISYEGLGRVSFSIEPHFCYENKRLKEMQQFIKKHKTDITAIPDASLIHVEDNKTTYIGDIIVFKEK